MGQGFWQELKWDGRRQESLLTVEAPASPAPVAGPAGTIILAVLFS